MGATRTMISASIPAVRPAAALAILAATVALYPAAAGAAGTEPRGGEAWTLDSLVVESTERPGLRRVYAEGTFSIPASRIWKRISGLSREHNWPGIKESHIEKVEGDTSILSYTLEIPVYRDRVYKLVNVADHPSMFLRFEMVPGYGNVREIHGSWKVDPLADSLTRVVYRLETDPGVRWIPGLILDWATRRAIPRAFAHIYEVCGGVREQDLGKRGSIR